MIEVFFTPRLITSTQQSILGIIPPLIIPVFFKIRNIADVDLGDQRRIVVLIL